MKMCKANQLPYRENSMTGEKHMSMKSLSASMRVVSQNCDNSRRPQQEDVRLVWRAGKMPAMLALLWLACLRSQISGRQRHPCHACTRSNGGGTEPAFNGMVKSAAYSDVILRTWHASNNSAAIRQMQASKRATPYRMLVAHAVTCSGR
jgi:hypothetical protein